MTNIYSPYINHFIQPDTIIPNSANPQSWNRFAYVINNPVRFNDPTGHRNCVEDGYNCPGDKIIKPTSTPTPTPSNTPVPTPTGPSVLKEAEQLVQKSGTGDMLWDWAMANGYSVDDYADTCIAHGGRQILLNPCRSAVFAAGTIAHEIFHDISFPDSIGSLQEEYLTYMVGDAVRSELIADGHGTSSDMFLPITEYTVNFENNPNLEQNLQAWFKGHGLAIYYRSRNEINGTPTGYGVPPFPLTFTPTP